MNTAQYEPLVDGAPRPARNTKALVSLAFLGGLLVAALLSSQTVSPSMAAEPTEELALRGIQNARAGMRVPIVQPYVQPIKALDLKTTAPMRTVYDFEPAAGRAVDRLSVQASASQQSSAPVVRAEEKKELFGFRRTVKGLFRKQTVADGLPWVVMKFGGSSVSTVERWGVITTQMKKIRDAGMRPFVAISALGSVTNGLGRSIDDALAGTAPKTEGSNYMKIYEAHMDLAEKLGVKDDTAGMKPLMDLLAELEEVLKGIMATKEVGPKVRARISSFGELMSTCLGILAIKKAGIPCVRLDARKLLKSTESATQLDDDKYLQGTVNPAYEPDLVKSELEGAGAVFSMDPKEASAALVQGFIGSTPSGDTCLLGRGGSDTSGALFAALVGAKKYEIWTDVHGLFTSDPRFVDGTRLIKETTYRAAQELATLGAKVLHERCLVPCAWADIPVEVHNTADPDGQFSLIQGSGAKPGPRLLGVTYRKGQTLLNIRTSNSLWGEVGFLGKVFEPFAALGTSIDLVAVSQYTVSVALDYIPGGTGGEAFAKLMGELQALGTVEMKPEMAVVSVVGENVRESLAELGGAMEEMRKRKVYMISQSSEDLSISFVVAEDDASAVVQGLHNVLLCGTPGDGKCVIDESVFGGSWDELKTEFLKVEAR